MWAVTCVCRHVCHTQARSCPSTGWALNCCFAWGFGTAAVLAQGGGGRGSLQLESPFLWPLWSMCSSSVSNTPARKSGTQSLFPSRAEHASQQAVQFPAHFVVHTPLCLHILFRVARPLHSNLGAAGRARPACSSI